MRNLRALLAILLITGAAASVTWADDAASTPPSPVADEAIQDHSAILEGRTLRSAKYGYTLTVPGDDWTLHPYATSPMQNKEADAELTNKGGGFCLVFCEDSTLNIKAFTDLCLDNLKKNAQPCEIIERVDKKVGGMDATLVKIKASVDGTSLRYVVLYAVGPKYMYQVMGWCAEPHYEDQEKIFAAFSETLSAGGEGSGTSAPATPPATGASPAP